MHICNCEHPYPVTQSDGSVIYVPCGKCDLCKSQKTYEWQERLKAETKSHKYCYFLTATYDDKHVPIFYHYGNSLIDFDSGEVHEDFGYWLKEKLDSIKYKDKEKYEREKNYVERYQTYTFARWSDIQNMFKRFRTYCQRNIEGDTTIRYFVCSELGPNTHRIHYHGLIWFDNDRVAECITSKLFEFYSWNTGTRKLPKYENLCRPERFTIEPDKGHASEYTSKYVTKDSSLPIVYEYSALRTKFVCSRKPIIGYSRFLEVTDEKLYDEGISEIHTWSNSKQAVVDVALPKSFKNRIFPKCLAFGKISSSDRMRMYRYVNFSSSQKNGLANHKNLVDLPFFEWLQLYVLHRPLLSLDDDYNICFKKEVNLKYFHLAYLRPSYHNGKYFISASQIKRCWLLSHKFIRLCQRFKSNAYNYIKRIEQYYSKINYENLKKQLNFESDYVREGHNLQELIYLFPDFIKRICECDFLLDYGHYRDVLLSQFNIDYYKLHSRLQQFETYDHFSQKAHYRNTGRYRSLLSLCGIHTTYDFTNTFSLVLQRRRNDKNKQLRYEDMEYHNLPYELRNYRFY